MTQERVKHEKEFSELQKKVGLLQAAVDSSRLEAKHSQSSEKLTGPRTQFAKLHTEGVPSVVQTVTGSAKANTRSINSMNRQMSKHAMVANSSNRNSSQILISNSNTKTPVGGQLPSTGVTASSQKHVLLNSQHASSQANLVTKQSSSGTGQPKKESQQVNLA